MLSISVSFGGGSKCLSRAPGIRFLIVPGKIFLRLKTINQAVPNTHKKNKGGAIRSASQRPNNERNKSLGSKPLYCKRTYATVRISHCARNAIIHGDTFRQPSGETILAAGFSTAASMKSLQYSFSQRPS